MPFFGRKARASRPLGLEELTVSLTDLDKVPRFLGGQTEPGNMELTPSDVHSAFLGAVYHQLNFEATRSAILLSEAWPSS